MYIHVYIFIYLFIITTITTVTNSSYATQPLDTLAYPLPRSLRDTLPWLTFLLPDFQLPLEPYGRALPIGCHPRTRLESPIRHFI